MQYYSALYYDVKYAMFARCTYIDSGNNMKLINYILV